MPPASRLSDRTAHGGTIVAGCPTVMIGYKPAARIADMHTCPLSTGPVPHVGGPIIRGSLTVIIGGMPQSRIGDNLICIGPPDVIATGEPTVMVGMVGAGGVMGLLMGLYGIGLAIAQKLSGPHPQAILQPDGSYVTQYNSSIRIEGTPEFQAKAVRDLDLIASTKSGQKLFESLNRSGKAVRIHTDVQTDPVTGAVQRGNWAWSDPPPSGSPPYTGYVGGGPANAQVGYDPDRTSLSGPPGSPYNAANWAQSPNRPADVGLYHELVHADDITHGKLDNTMGQNLGPRAGSSIPNSELRAAGLTPYNNESYSENTYRADRGLPQRGFY